MVTEVFVDVSICVAHWLPKVSAHHKCAVMHGHNYEIRLYVRGEVHDDGMVQDYQVVLDAWRPLHKLLDHRTLNDVEGLSNPTCENLGAWILERMPMVTSVRVYETKDAGAIVCRAREDGER